MNKPSSCHRLLASLILFSATAQLLLGSPGSWPQWRGPDRTDLSSEKGLLAEWPKDGPQVLWKTENVGVGYSTLAIADGRIITQGDLDGVEHIIALSEKDGSLLWAVQPRPVIEALEKKIAADFARMDRNEDGKLDDVEAMGGLGSRFVGADEADRSGDAAKIATARTARFMKQLDQNGDGRLENNEIPGALIREMGRIDQAKRGNIQALAASRADAALAASDQDGDQQISQGESRNTLLQQLFRNIDGRKPGERRGDGQLTRDEMVKYFSTKERGRDGVITAEEVEKYFVKFHAGSDGVLSKADLKRVNGGYRNGQGDGPRGTPTIDGKVIYTEGGNGDLTCLDAATGSTMWHLNLVSDLGGRRPGWGYSESPLLDGDNLIVTPGGSDGAIAALNKNTGEVVWRSTDLPDSAHYSSPIVATVHGVKQIIQFTRERLVGVDAKTGKLLWSYKNSANGTANCTTPIYHDGHVFSASAYGTGGGLVKLSRNGNQWSAEEVYFEKSMQNHHGGIVLVGDHMYGFGSRDLICMNFKTGRIAWQETSVGKGSLTYADGRLYCLGERNALGLVAANPNKYVEKGRISTPRTGRPSWAHPVVTGGRLYVRDQHTLTCFDVSVK
jgi:outer membrane protein assembly factor BamB